MRAYYPNPPGEGPVDDLRAAVASRCTIYTSERPNDYELLIEGRATEELVAAPSLKGLIVPFAGVPEATLGLLRDRPQITGYNLHHNASDTAEVAVALLYAAAKLIVPMDQRLRRHDWGSRYEDSRSVALAGKRVLVLGYGQIGRRIARVLVAAGMHVTALRRHAMAAIDDGVEIHASSALHEQLRSAEVLVIALPQTSETKGLIGERELLLLPQGAILVNIARGPIVDEEALYNALKRGHLHSAGLDVWYQYPQAAANTVPGYFNMPEMAASTPPSRFAFGELDNVVMSPHRAGTSMDTERHRVRDLAELILAIVRGDQVPNKIDLNAGY